MLYIEEEEFQDLECPHCRIVLSDDDEFMNHICPEDLLDGIPLMEDIN